MKGKISALITAAVVMCNMIAVGTSSVVSAQEGESSTGSAQVYDYAAQFNQPPWSLWYRNRFTGELHGVCPVADGSFNAWNNYLQNCCAFTTQDVFIGRDLKPTIAFTAPQSGEAKLSAMLSGWVFLHVTCGGESVQWVEEGAVAQSTPLSCTLTMEKGETLYLNTFGGDDAADWTCGMHIESLQVEFTPDDPVPVESDEFMLEAGESVRLTSAEGVTVTGENDAVSYKDGMITALKAGNAQLVLSAPGHSDQKVYVGVKGTGVVSDYAAWDYTASPRPAGEDNFSYFLYDQIKGRYLPASCNWGGYINQNMYSSETDWVVFSGTSYLNIANNNTYDTVLAYCAPRSGYLSIDDDLAFMDPRDGSGVAVMHNNQRVFPSDLPWALSGVGNSSFEGDGVARITLRLYGLEVEKGDWIFLRFNCNIQGGGNLDQVAPRTVFTLTPKEDV